MLVLYVVKYQVAEFFQFKTELHEYQSFEVIVLGGIPSSFQCTAYRSMGKTALETANRQIMATSERVRCKSAAPAGEGPQAESSVRELS